ncbi:MAG: GlxA family transcriptional regulator [Proteobacteria bacterium]|nr:GlxA family transcriptional regulator [Pseudomonadota bacterium]
MKRLGLVAFPGFQILDLAAASVFEVANGLASRPVYEVGLYSEHGGHVVSSSGIEVQTRQLGDPAFDTVIVAGDMAVAPASDGLVRLVVEAAAASRRIASICTGAFILAAGGLLNGRRATTHWAGARTLQRKYPAVRVEEDRIFINDGNVWTSAGMTACIDLSLAMVEADLGFEVSKAVAQKMVVYHRRTGGQSQFSAMLPLESKSDRIQLALDYAKRNLRKSLSVGELAEVANLSSRQFSRTFRAETGQSPAKAIESLRVEAAKSLVEESRHAIDVVARETGFADPERMRRAFIRKFGHPPQTFRRVAHKTAIGPTGT